MARWPRGRSVAWGVALSLGCGGGSAVGPVGQPDVAAPPATSPPLARLTMSLTRSTLEVGETANTTVTGYDQRGNSIGVVSATLTSSVPTVATVSTSGVVTGVSVGTATVTAASGAVSTSLSVTVTASAPPAAVVRVAVTPLTASLVVGQALQLTATLVGADGREVPGRIATWASTSDAVAAVSASGLVSARSAGSAIIIATIDGTPGSVPVAVAGVPHPDIVVAIASPQANQGVDDSVMVVATVRHPGSLARVTATVGAEAVVLRSVPAGATGQQEAWVGSVLLTGMRFGSYRLVVTALDTQSRFGADSVAFERRPKADGGTGSPGGGYRIVAPTDSVRRRPKPAVRPPADAAACPAVNCAATPGAAARTGSPRTRLPEAPQPRTP